MHQKKSKKILVYFFLFFIIGTFNNKNLNKIDIYQEVEIQVSGLDDQNNIELMSNLEFLKIDSLFFLDELKLKKIINSNNLVEKFSIFKHYPYTLNIKIDKTNFLAKVKKDGNDFYLGSNGKLININDVNKNIPTIFGDFKNQNFFELKEAINDSNFDYKEIRNLFFFKSGRWDIETKNGLLVKLPKDNLKNSLNLFIQILNNNDNNRILLVDLRQENQIIINER